MAPRTVPLHEPAEARAMLHAEHPWVRALFQRYEHSRDPHLRRQIASQVWVALELQALLDDAGGVPAVADAPGQGTPRWARTPVWPTSPSSRGCALCGAVIPTTYCVMSTSTT